MTRTLSRSMTRATTRALSGGISTEWTPADYAGTFDGWYDASLATGAEEDPIELPDRSSAGHNATNATEALRLLLIPEAKNGLNVARGDGTQYYTRTMTASSTRTIFLVYRRLSGALNFLMGFPASADDATIYTDAGTRLSFYPNQANGLSTLNAAQGSSWWLLELNFSSLSVCTPTINGVDGTAFDPKNHEVGGTAGLWAGRTGALPFVGDLAELIDVTDSVSAADQLRFRTYLSRKWGLGLV